MSRAAVRCAAVALLVGVVLGTGPAWAHKPSDSYLGLHVTGAHVAGRWDISLRDLERAVGLDADGNGEVTWGEVRARAPALDAYALSRLKVQGDGEPCAAAAGEHRVVRHSDGAYLALAFALACPKAPRTLELEYTLLFDEDPQHRGLARIEAANVPVTATFTDVARTHRVELGVEDASGQFASMVRQGAVHIWEGLDHLLFLLALLLPSVLRRDAQGAWEPLPRFGPVLADVVRIVTAFTVAHSLTLSIAALDVLRLPSRWVEAGVALSVVVAALNNVRPFLRGNRWVAAFALGLLHGFAFSETLVDLGLSGGHLLRTLFGFNLGVEFGQLAVVTLCLPLAYASRASRAYRRLVLVGGSMAVIALAVVWFVERALEISILPA